MVVMTKPLLNPQITRSAALLVNQHAHKKSALGDVSQNAVEVALKNNDFESNIASGANVVGAVGGIGWMVHAVLPGAGNLVSKFFSLVGSGASAIGASGAANTLDKAAGFIENASTRYTTNLVGNYRPGRAIATATDKMVGPVYGVFQKVEDLFHLPSKLAARAAAKSELFASKATMLASGLGHVPPEVSQGVLNLVNVPIGDAKNFTMAQEALAGHLSKFTIPKADRKIAKQVMKFSEKAQIFAQKSNNWSELATGRHNTFENVKKSSLHIGVGNGLLSMASIASVVGTTAETVSDVKTFRHLVADITGKDVSDVNSGDALFSTLPHAGEVARRALLSSATPRAILEGINTVFNIKMIKGSHVGILAFLIPAGLSQAIGIFTQGNILDVYKGMKKNEAAGQENMPDQYAALIGMSHKGLHQRGGNNSNFAQELGRMYAERHASVKEVLQAVGNGQMDREIQAIIAHNAAESKAENVPATNMQQVTAVQPNIATPHQFAEHPHADAAKTGFAARIAEAQQHAHQPVRQ